MKSRAVPVRNDKNWRAQRGVTDDVLRSASRANSAGEIFNRDVRTNYTGGKTA